HVPYPLEVLVDVALLVGLVICIQRVGRTALAKRRKGRLGRQHSGLDGVMAALYARHVHEAGATADQRPTREGKLRNRLQAAFGESTRAVDDALTALKILRDHRVMLDALEFVEWREI